MAQDRRFHNSHIAQNRGFHIFYTTQSRGFHSTAQDRAYHKPYEAQNAAFHTVHRISHQNVANGIYESHSKESGFLRNNDK
jgi:hypothetical protein